jgi:hypothetical protein
VDYSVSPRWSIQRPAPSFKRIVLYSHPCYLPTFDPPRFVELCVTVESLLERNEVGRCKPMKQMKINVGGRFPSGPPYCDDIPSTLSLLLLPVAWCVCPSR